MKLLNMPGLAKRAVRQLGPVQAGCLTWTGSGTGGGLFQQRGLQRSLYCRLASGRRAAYILAPKIWLAPVAYGQYHLHQNGAAVASSGGEKEAHPDFHQQLDEKKVLMGRSWHRELKMLAA